MIVVKFGGHAMTDSDGLFATAIKDAVATGQSVVVVHGGGPQINKALDDAGIASSFIGGFRVTTQETYNVVERVLAKEIGPSLARSLNDHGVKAVAVSGRDVIIATKQLALVDGTPAELGFVGTVTDIATDSLFAHLDKGEVVVLSPVASNVTGEIGFNVNADIAAAAVAGALKADALIIMTDVPGIYRKWPDTSSLIETISFAELNEIKSTFAQGMAPKVQACLDAIKHGAQAVRIIDGTDPQAFSLALAHKGGTLVNS